MTDEEAYRFGKRIADDMVRSGRAIRLGDGGGGYRHRRGPSNQVAKWMVLAVVIGVVVLLVWIAKASGR